MILLSIIIPTYNSDIYLNTCLKSIETNIKDLSNIEVIIIDDNSKYTNNKLDLINHWKTKFSCRLIINEYNLGPGVSREKGLQTAVGKFIQFMDDDDIYINDPLSCCDESFDIISTKTYFNNRLVNPEYMCAALHGIIYNKDYLDSLNVHFAPIAFGCEDSLFRAASFMLTSKIKIIDDFQFYKHIDNTNSSFGKVKRYDYNNWNTSAVQEDIEWSILFFKYYSNLLINKCSSINLKYYSEWLHSMYWDFTSLAKDNSNILINYYFVSLAAILKIMTSDKIKDNVIINYNEQLSDEVKEIFIFTDKCLRIKYNYLFIKKLKCKQFEFLDKSQILNYTDTDIIICDYMSSIELITNFYYKYSIVRLNRISEFREEIENLFK